MLLGAPMRGLTRLQLQLDNHQATHVAPVAGAGGADSIRFHVIDLTRGQAFERDVAAGRQCGLHIDLGADASATRQLYA